MSISSLRTFNNIKNLLQKGRFKEIIQTCEDSRNLDGFSEEEKLSLDIFKLNALVNLRYIKEALQLAECIKQQCESQKKIFEKIETQLYESKAFINYQDKERVNQGREILEQVYEAIKIITDISEENQKLLLFKIHETEGI